MFNWAKQQLANVAGTQEPIWGPSAIRSVAEEDEPAGYTELSREDLTWKELDFTNVESQIFYLTTNDGRIAWVQVIYSNVMGIAISAHLNIKVYSQQESTPHFWSSVPIDDLRFSDDKTALYGENVSIELSEDGTSYKIQSSVNETTVDLDITRTCPGFHAGKTGLTLFGTDFENPSGSMRHAFWPRCTAEGTITTHDGSVDCHGRAIFIYALQGMKPHHAAARWNFISFQGPTYSAVLMEFTTPASYGSTVVNVGGIVKDGAIISAGCTNTVDHTETKLDPDNDWQEPSSASFTWEGKDKGDRMVEAELKDGLGPRVERIDIMAELPVFVKSILASTVGLRPYVYQFMPKSTLKVKIGEDEVEETGQCIVEATFICD